MRDGTGDKAMLLIGICDDELKECAYVQTICETYLQERKAVYQIIAFHSAEEVLAYCLENPDKRIDLLFLDIEMGGMSGIELMHVAAHEVGIGDIVFVSAHKEEMCRAFSRKTIGFLPKPVSEEQIIEPLELVYRESIDNEPLKYRNYRGDVVSVRTGDILYFKADGGYTHINIRQADCGGQVCSVITKKLGDIEKGLKGQSFLRVHRSYLVNMHYVAAIGAKIRMQGLEEKIPIGRTRKEEVQRQYAAYIKGGLKRHL